MTSKNLAPRLPKPAALPAATLEVVLLADLDLSTELYTLYVKAKQMLEDGAEDPLNQRAQTLNAIVSTLDKITKIRTELYNSERLKKLEACLLETLKAYPEMQEDFIVAYEEALNNAE